MDRKKLIGILWLQGFACVFGMPSERMEYDSSTATPDEYCTTSCSSKQDGDYQSCQGCHVYVTCTSGMLSEHPCPPGHVWDDDIKNCEMMSNTCGQDEALSFMDIEDNMQIGSIGENETQMPDSLSLRLLMEQKDMVLNLTKSEHITADFPIILAEDGEMVRHMVPEGERFALYVDKATSASFIVKPKLGSQGQVHLYEGIFRMDEEDYFIQPSPIQSSSQHRLHRRAQPAGAYMARKVKATTPDVDLEMPDMREQIMEITRDQDQVLAIAQELGTLPNGVQRYQVEVLLFLDFAIYNKWLKLSKKTYHYQREAEALANIRFYYSHVMNGVDLRYNSIEDPMMEISFKLNGIYIAKTSRDSPWTQSHLRDYYYTEAYDALDDFELWLLESRTVLPPFDLAALFSGYYLYSGTRTDGSLRTIGGLADIKGACNQGRLWYGASINYDNGLYAAKQTLAHEMGHNLGSYHDGDYRFASSCSGRDQYIMASAPGVLTDNTYKNAFRFSHCSIKSIKDYLMFLTMEGKNCLLETPTHPTETVASARPGLIYTPDQQCQIVYGGESFYCGGGGRDQSICREMWCMVPATGRCATHAEQRAYDGTTCGNNMWCDSGDCVSHSDAPAAPQSCIYGDLKEPFRRAGQPDITCSQLIKQAPYTCYREDYNRDCCASCEAHRDDSKPDCEYGDHTDCSSKQPWNCYEKQTEESCCLFCEAFATGIKGCEYGNKRSGSYCAGIRDSQCYRENTTCCEECMERKDRINSHVPGCEYGDKEDWCPNFINGNRYQCHRYSDTCCQTCGNLRGNDQECPWGDRRRSCRQSDCQYPSQWSDCCETCRDERLRHQTTHKPTTTSVTSTLSTRKPITTSVTSTTQSTVHTTKTTESECLDSASYCPDMPVRYCYSSYNKTCCQRCRDAYNPAKVGCEYGDKFGWCMNYIGRNMADLCLRDDKLRSDCCQSCDGVGQSDPTDTPTVSCSDSVSWCSQYIYTTSAGKQVAGHCYNDRTRDIDCCGTCMEHKTGPDSCPYGDQYDWCNIKHCDSNVKQQCCKTCGSK